MYLFCLFPPCRDRLRTTTNVLGDSLGAGIVEHLSRRELQRPQERQPHGSAIEEEKLEMGEKPYRLIFPEEDAANHHNGETAM